MVARIAKGADPKIRLYEIDFFHQSGTMLKNKILYWRELELCLILKDYYSKKCYYEMTLGIVNSRYTWVNIKIYLT